MNDDLQNDTIKLSPRRVYHCPNCQRLAERKDVKKNSQGVFYCSLCSSPVVDKTNTETGQDFMEILLL